MARTKMTEEERRERKRERDRISQKKYRENWSDEKRLAKIA